MGDDLEVRGGSGGVQARYDDLLLLGRQLAAAADDLGELASATGRETVSGPVLESGLLCPGGMTETEAALGTAAAEVAAEAVELESLARFTRVAVETYRAVDDELARLANKAIDLVASTIGKRFGPEILVGLGASAFGVWLCDQIDGGFADEVIRAADEELYREPVLQEALTRGWPGLVTGTLSVSPLLRGLLRLTAWPGSDSRQQLLSAAVWLGLVSDQGRFAAHPVGAPRPVPLSYQPLASLMDQVAILDERSRRHTTIQVIRVPAHGPGARTHWVVQIPGTTSFGLQHDRTVSDMATNVALMAQDPRRPAPVLVRKVQEAMSRAGIRRGDPVMVCGYSEGGIAAAALAIRPGPFHVTDVVTAGAPIGQFKIPPKVSVLAMEHREDIVPRFDGHENPDRATWTTVRRRLGDEASTLEQAHALDHYRRTAIDADLDPGLEGWRRARGGFFGSDATGQGFEIRPEGSAEAGRVDLEPDVVDHRLRHGLAH